MSQNANYELPRKQIQKEQNTCYALLLDLVFFVSGASKPLNLSDDVGEVLRPWIFFPNFPNTLLGGATWLKANPKTNGSKCMSGYHILGAFWPDWSKFLERAVEKHWLPLNGGKSMLGPGSQCEIYGTNLASSGVAHSSVSFIEFYIFLLFRPFLLQCIYTFLTWNLTLAEVAILGCNQVLYSSWRE